MSPEILLDSMSRKKDGHSMSMSAEANAFGLKTSDKDRSNQVGHNALITQTDGHIRTERLQNRVNQRLFVCLVC